MTGPPERGGAPHPGRRMVVRSLLRSGLATVLLVVAYYLLPLDLASGAVVVWLVVGLAAVGAVLAWQVRAIAAADHPRLRAIGALAIGLPLLLLVFAGTYAAQARADPASFNEPLDRTAALYFAVTVFATVGFGDIVPVTEAARVATMIQMVLDVVAIGTAARVILGAVDTGLRRRAAGSEAGSEKAGDDGDARRGVR